MEQSILKSTKKILGIHPDNGDFDTDVITFTNGALSTLTDLGVGPAVFQIEDDSALWHELVPDDDVLLNKVKVYVYLIVRRDFNPPDTGALLTALNNTIVETEARINVYRETMPSA